MSGHPVYTKEEEQLLEYAALAECHSTHPISVSLQKAYGRKLDVDRVTDVQEIGGHGVIATVDGHRVAAGNDKLMKKKKLRTATAAVPVQSYIWQSMVSMPVIY